MRGSWLIGIILAFLMTFLVFWGSAKILIAPLEAESYDLLKELKIQRAQKRELKNRISAVEEKTSRFQKLQKEVNSVELEIPLRKEITQLIARLPALAKKSRDRKSTRLNSSHIPLSRMPSSA